MRNKIFTTAAAAALVSVFAFGASAQEGGVDSAKTGKNAERGAEWKARGGDRKHGGMKGKRGGMHRGGMMLGKLDLTDAQKAQIKGIREANRPDPSSREEMRSLMKAKYDGTITADQQVRLDTIRRANLDRSVIVRGQIEAVLTAEQRAKMEEHKAAMKTRMEERRKMREAKKAASIN
jgi:Spy/CpxP family protein refolding chaperone